MRMHTRHITSQLVAALADTPVVVINGARQSGKSTLVQMLARADPEPRRYLTLDDPVVLKAARSDPAGFINGLQGQVTLDEVQRAPELFLPIKAAVDRNRQPGRFLLTGSADVMLCYFALLEMLFLVVRLPSWERNPGKRLVKAPTVFLPDSGMLCYFLAATAESLAARPGLPGGIVETWVLSE